MAGYLKKHAKAVGTPPQTAPLDSKQVPNSAMINNYVGTKTYRYPRIGVLMVDEDVVSRVGKLWNIKVFVYDPKGPSSRKRVYRVTKVGFPAAAWMRELFPLMGKRRQAQITRVLDEWDSRPSTREMRSKSCSEAAFNRWRSKEGQLANKPEELT